MEPRDMTAAQLLDATICEMEANGPDAWFQIGRKVSGHPKAACVQVAAFNLLGCRFEGTAYNKLNDACRDIYGHGLTRLNDTADDFDDILYKLRQIKAML